MSTHGEKFRERLTRPPQTRGVQKIREVVWTISIGSIARQCAVTVSVVASWCTGDGQPDTASAHEVLAQYGISRADWSARLTPSEVFAAAYAAGRRYRELSEPSQEDKDLSKLVVRARAAGVVGDEQMLRSIFRRLWIGEGEGIRAVADRLVGAGVLREVARRDPPIKRSRDRRYFEIA